MATYRVMFFPSDGGSIEQTVRAASVAAAARSFAKRVDQEGVVGGVEDSRGQDVTAQFQAEMRRLSSQQRYDAMYGSTRRRKHGRVTTGYCSICRGPHVYKHGRT